MDQRMLQKLIKDAQAKKLQLEKKMKDVQMREFTSKVGNNLIEITMNGSFEVVACRVDDTVLNDKDTLEDLIVSAVNDVIRKVNDEIKSVEASIMPMV